MTNIEGRGVLNPPDGDERISLIVDEGRPAPFFYVVQVTMFLAVMLDGLGYQLLGLMLPSLIEAWDVPKSSFTAALSLGLVGGAVSGLAGGWLGDRFGRKRMIIGCLMLFGSTTAAIALISDTASLGALRLLAGLGLGGMLPNITTLIAEITPMRRRNLAVALIILGAPIGAMVGAAVVAPVTAAVGWKGMFLICGLLPVATGVVALKLLVESPRFLAHRNQKAAAFRVLTRLGYSAAPATDGKPVAHVVYDESGGLKLLDYWRPAFALGLLLLAAQLYIYEVVSWLPAVLAERDFSARHVGVVMALFNAGCAVGSLSSVWIIDRLDRQVSFVILTLGAATVALLSAWSSILQPSSAIHLQLALFSAGLFGGGLTTAVYNVCAQVFPTRARASGTGLVITVGRLGSASAAALGAWGMAVDGPRGLFWTMAPPMIVAALAIPLLRRRRVES